MNKNISALLICIGLIVLGIFIRFGFSSIRVANTSRVVSVRGLAEKEVKANKVTWPIVYKIVGNDLVEIYDEIESTNKIISDFLTSNGIDKEQIIIAAPSVEDRAANSYSYDRPSMRYNVTMTITVTSNDIDLVNSLINRQGELLKKGVAIVDSDWSRQIIYEYTDLNSIKPDMIAEATKKAREAAEKFAEDSGSKLGKIKNAQQGQFSINDRDPYTPFIKNVRVVTYIDYELE